jgi:hypothetical protein
MSDAFGSAACSCGTMSRCNSRLDGYNPVLLVLNVGFCEISKIYFKLKLAFLGDIFRGRFRQLRNSLFDVLKRFVVEIAA